MVIKDNKVNQEKKAHQVLRVEKVQLARPVVKVLKVTVENPVYRGPLEETVYLVQEVCQAHRVL